MTKPLTDAQMAEARTVPYWQRNPFRALLTARFPKAFAPIRSAIKHPLKRDIYTDLRERCPDLTGAQILTGLADYTGGPSYHRACLPSAVRIDLNGDAVGSVTLEECAYHAGRLLELIAKREKQNLKREQARLAREQRRRQLQASAEAMAQSDPEYRGADHD